ncbi:cation:proton antiporter [Paradesertivirga mongoliensis]|uniref:Cation:proton antiporter n=1 Tax=Paradesertivirga mongoliensis TaxID=2100740 RepID=A0ABW4ZNJ3_9SPHI|nr:cation:proton antiporter [Pedobacter mongoliensis]
MEYFLLLALIGLAAFGMAWMPAISRITRISYSIIYLVLGILSYLFIPDILPVPDMTEHREIAVRVTELVVIVSLMGTGIKIDRAFTFKNWSTPLRLIGIAMIACIAVTTAIGYSLLGLGLASALLLASALAPTDPVLAGDVQVGPPNEKIKSETKFALTAEAGLNDGMAFPFIWLAIVVAGILQGSMIHGDLMSWLSYHVVYKLLAGAAIGYALGRLAGYLVFTMTEKYKKLKTRDGFLAISLTLIVYGITEMAQGYGFIAVFISSITLRHFDKKHEYHDDLHSFVDQTERLLVAMLLLLFGGALVNGILQPLTWKMVLFSVLFVLVVRPATAYLSLYGKKIHIKEKLAISFFGIRGVGSVFYLAFAFGEFNFDAESELWATVAFSILLSILLHGFTASPIMQHLRREIPEENIPG